MSENVYRSMTDEEALAHFKNHEYMTGFSWQDEMSEVAIEAIEKQIPKKPLLEGDGYYDGEMVYDGWRCPNCDEYFEIDEEAYKYCPECGQRICWEEGGEE